VAFIEYSYFGGTCVNTGCTPTKAMIGSARVAHYARHAAKWGVHAGLVTVNMREVLARKNEIVEQSRVAIEKRADKNENIHVFRGRGRFLGPKQVEVLNNKLESDHIFIDTGSTAVVPKIKGLDSVNYLTNEGMLDVREVPEHLVVIGAGYCGLEFAQMFARFGSEVTVITDSEHILPHEDRDIADELQRSLESEEIRFVKNARIHKVNSTARQIEVEFDGAPDDTIYGTHLLIATGRKANTHDLDLSRAGVDLDAHGNIIVNRRLETTTPGIWALGDVKGGPMFTHSSYNDYQIVFGNLYEGKDLATDTRIVPYAIYTDPELGRVGMTEKEAREKGYKLKVGCVKADRIARARERGETNGLLKLVVDASNDQILGASLLCSDGGEVVQILSTLMLAKQPYTLLKSAIYIHPTMTEGLYFLIDSVKPV
jgi:pyruvate/2-oxoglutarate dehydrogenase complex dihydrolipoamide dehydrogenase (E3) component